MRLTTLLVMGVLLAALTTMAWAQPGLNQTNSATLAGSIDVEKYTNGQDADAAPGPSIIEGATVTWRYVIRNTGDIGLINITLTDDKLGSITLPKTALDPGTSMEVSVNGVAGKGQYANTATVQGGTSIGMNEQIFTDKDDSHYFGVAAAPAVDLKKYVNDDDANSPTGPTVNVGSTVTFKYVVTNTGNVEFGSINIVDDKLGNIGPFTDVTLPVGATKTITKTATAVAGQYKNTATVTAVYNSTNYTDSDVAHYYGFTPNPSVDIKKYVNDDDANSPTGPTVNVGSTVTFKYVVTNTGNVEFGSINIVDDKLGNIGPFTDVTLPVGATKTITKTATAVAGQYKNTATVTAVYNSTNYTDSDVAHYYGFTPNPSIDIKKYTNDEDADTPTGPYVTVGSTVTWKYVITNTGNVEFGSFTVVDDKLGDLGPYTTDTLPPGATKTITKTGTAVAGQYKNSATVTAVYNSVPYTDTDVSHYYGVAADPKPAIDVEKYTNDSDADSPTGPYLSIGSTVTWKYVVTNTGNVPLTSVALVDDKLGAIPMISAVIFEPGASTTVTKTGTVVAGQYKNVATVTASYQSTNVQDQDASHYFGITGTPTPKIDIEKYTNDEDADTPTGPNVPVGSTVTWKYVITNTGNVEFGSFNVVDDKLGNLGPFTDVTLPVGATRTITKTGIAVAGQYKNTATVTAVFNSTNYTDSDASHYYGFTPNPSIDIEKYTNDEDADSPTGPYVTVGSTVTWKYVITNTGNVEFGSFTVVDDKLGDLGPYTTDTLPPGATKTITKTGTAVAGQYKNSATVTAVYNSVPYTDTDVSHYYGVAADPKPAIDVEKYTNDSDADSPTGPYLSIGSTVTWKYVVTNTGNVPLTSVALVDDKLGAIPMISAVIFEPGASTTVTKTGTVVAGQYKNVATVTASYQSTNVQDQDPAHYYGVNGTPTPKVDIEKSTNNQDADTATGPVIPVGQTVTWKYTVTNNGNVPIELVNVKDNKLGVIWETTTPGAVIMAPGEIKTYTRTGTAVVGQYENIATVTAYTTDGATADILLTDSDPSHYLGIETKPSIDIEKYTNDEDADEPTGPYVAIGSTVTWKYVITNTGNVEFGSFSVVDDKLGDLGPYLDVTLPPGASRTIIKTGTAVGGQYKNSATVTAISNGTKYTDTDVSHYFGINGEPRASIDIEKFVNNLDADVAPGPSVAVGSTVTWTYTINNNGNVPLSVLDVIDDKLGPVSFISDHVLDPGETWTATRTGTAVAGPYVNIVTVRARDAQAKTDELVTDSDPAHYYGTDGAPNPAVDIEKFVNGQDADAPTGPQIPAGQTVTWTYTVANSGNTQIELVNVVDDKLGVIWESSHSEKITLNVGQSRTWTRTGKAILGQYKNTATVSATAISGQSDVLLKDSDSAHYYGVQANPAIDIEKYTNDEDADTPIGPVVQVGSTVTWKYVITNTGNIEFGSFTVVDDKLGDLGPYLDVTLPPGATRTIIKTGTAVAGQYKNTATVTAFYLGETFKDTDPSHYYGINGQPAPAIDIEKYTNEQDADTAPGPILAVGAPVTWKYVITNTGNIPLGVDEIVDSREGVLSVTTDAQLDPGESWTLTKSGTAVLGQYENRATVNAHSLAGKADQLVTDSDLSHYLGAGATPSIDIKKYTNDMDADLPPGPAIAIGSAVTWKYVITNTGNVAMVIKEVIDSAEGSIPFTTDAKLDPGQSLTLTKTGVAKAGQYKNTATVKAVYQSGQTSQEYTDSDLSHYYGTQGEPRPGIDIEKATNGEDADSPTGPVLSIGATVTWSYVVTNNSNTPVELNSVKDDKLGTIWQSSAPRAVILYPGDTRSYSRTGAAVLGQYKNMGSVFAGTVDSKADVLLTDTDASHYLCVDAKPSLDLEKYTNDLDADVPTGPIVQVGSTVTWKYVVTNTGNVALGGLQVVDDHLGNLGPFTEVMLQPGQSHTIVKTGTAIAGQYRNIATATATYLGQKVQDQDLGHYYGISGQPTPVIDVEKYTNEMDADLPPGPTVPAGNVVNWKYVVNNKGNVPIEMTKVTDDKLGIIWESSTPGEEILDVGETKTFTRTGTAAVGQYANTAMVNGGVVIGTADMLLTDTDKSHYLGIDAKPGIDIEKYTNNEDADEAPGPLIPVGQTVTWKYVVRNTGNVALASVTVRDDKLGLIGVHVDILFEPGQSFTLTRTGIAEPGLYKNIGTVTATYNGVPVSDSDPSHYYGTQGGTTPSIDIEKYTNGEDADLAPGPTIAVGAAVTWSYIITNNGNVPLDIIRLVDNVEGAIPMTTDARLNPGESVTVTKTGVAKLGQYENEARVEARNPNGDLAVIYSDTDKSHYLGVKAGPAIDIEKYTNGVDADTPTGPAIPIGQTVTWLYVITNTGNVALGGLNVVDDKLGNLGPFLDVMFEPGKTINITRTGVAVAGQYKNIATATASYFGQQVQDVDPSHYIGIDNQSRAAIDIEKFTNNEDADLAPGPYISSGKPVTWKYVVTNTGTVPLSLIDIVDSKEGKLSMTDTAALQPGESRTYTKVGTAKLGQYENEAVVRASNTEGQTELLVTDKDMSHYYGILGDPKPAIEIKKYTNDQDADAPPGPQIPEGGAVTWQYNVKNIGNVPLSYLSVTDDQLGSVFQTPDPNMLLLPGETKIFTRFGKATVGQYKNSARVSAKFGAVTVEDTDPSHYFGVTSQFRPVIDIEKYTNNEDADIPTGPEIAVGQTVTWKYVVKNTGMVALVNLTITDDKLGRINPPLDVTLEPGASRTYTKTGVAVLGQYKNIAVATAEYQGTVVRDEDPSHYLGVIKSAASIDIEKYTNNEDADAAPGPSVQVGSTVTWKYIIKNTGGAPLALIDVIDSQEGAVSISTDAQLDPDETITLTKTGIAKAGQYENEAVVRAALLNSPAEAFITDRDLSHYLGIEEARPAIDVEKFTNNEDADLPPGPTVPVGSEVTWLYKVKNVGNVPLQGLVVTDDKLGYIYLNHTTMLDILAVGEERVYTRKGTAVAGQYENTATATANYLNITVTDNDKSHYYGGDGVQPKVEIIKSTNGQDANTPPGPSIMVGQTVKWDYQIKNIGNVPLSKLSLVDDQLGVIALPGSLSLPPGQSITVSKTGNAIAGQYVNIATVTGEYQGKSAQDNDPSHYFGTDQAAPSIDVEKYTNDDDADEEPGPSLEIGTRVTWKYVIVNNGNVTLTNLQLTDDKLGAISLPTTTLTPGQSITVTRIGDVVEGPYANTGLVVAKYNDQTVRDSDLAHYVGTSPKDFRPAIDVEKYINDLDADEEPGPTLTIGSTATWKYVITNSGSVALTGVALVDDKEGPIQLPSTELAAGQSMTVTRTTTVVAGQYVNIAVATANAQGSLVQDSDVAYYFGQQATGPRIDVEKYTNGLDADVAPGPYVMIGSRVTWKYIIANTGDVALTNLSLTDDKEGTIFLPQTGLDVGKSLTIYRNGTAGAGQYRNVARVTAKSGASQVEDTDVSHYYGTNEAMPSIQVIKSTNGEDANNPPGPSIYIGKPVTWQYVITNTGNVALTNVTLTDDKIGGIMLPATSLTVGQSITVSKQGVALMGQYRNVAHVTALYNSQTVQATDASHYLGNLGQAGGSIFEDANRNRRQDATDPLLGGWKVKLQNESTLQLYEMTSEAGSGKWYFAPEVPAGVYMVSVVLQDQWTNSYPNTFDGRYRINYFGYGQYTLLSEEPSDYVDLSFGVVRVQQASILGYVFYDSNTNGIRDVIEAGLQDVTVQLYHNGQVAASSLTNAKGLYEFSNLSPGAYVINVDEATLPAHYILTTDNEPYFVDLTLEQLCTDADFGYVRLLKDWGMGDRWLLARYQAWYGNSSDPANSRHWEESQTGGHVHTSLIGAYDSDDPEVLEYHILSAWAAGIDGFVVDWFGEQTYENTALLTLLDRAEELTKKYNRNGFNFEIASAYKQLPDALKQRMTTPSYAIDVSYLGEVLMKHPAYWGLRRGTTSPVYIMNEQETGLSPNAFREEAKLQDAASIVWNGFLKNILGEVEAYSPSLEKLVPALQPNGLEWGNAYLDSTYRIMNTAAKPGDITFAVGQVWPGYDDRPWTLGKGKWMDRQEQQVYEQTWNKVHSYEYPLYMPWVLIDSWNGWNQGTEIEPSVETGYNYLMNTRDQVRTLKDEATLAAKGMENLGLLVPLHIYQARLAANRNTNLASISNPYLDVALQSFFNGENLLAMSLADVSAGLAPKPLHLLETGVSSVKLGWERCENADGYRLHYSQNPEDFAPLSEIKPISVELGNVQEYTLSNLPANGEVYIAITARNSRLGMNANESWYENMLTGAEIMKVKLGAPSATPAGLVFLQGLPLAGTATAGRSWMEDIYGIIPDWQSPTLSQMPGEIPSDPYWTIFRFDDYQMHSFASLMLELSHRLGPSGYAPSVYFEVLISNQSIRPNDFISMGFFECPVDGSQHWFGLNETISAQFVMIKMNTLTFDPQLYQIDQFSVLTEMGSTGVVTEEQAIPESFKLEQNYPNPFNGATHINYQLPEATHVTLKIYNIMGQLVEILVDRQQTAGHYSVPWHNRSKASGLYFYQLNAGKFRAVKRMTMIK